ARRQTLVRLAAPAVLRHKHQAAGVHVVVAVGPAEVVPPLDPHELLAWVVRTSLDAEAPVVGQLVPPHDRAVESTARGIDRQGDCIPEPGSPVLTVGETLARSVGGKAPDPRPGLELGAGIPSGRV